MVRLFCWIVVAVFGAVVCPAAVHAQNTAFGHIFALQTGSLDQSGDVPGHFQGGALVHVPHRVAADDTVTVWLDVPFVNSLISPAADVVVLGAPSPEGLKCPNTSGGYALDPADAGTKINQSVLLSAYLVGRKVRITLDGCVFGMPRIVGVGMNNTVQ